MIILALGFVFGAWLLQQQAVLPALHWALLLIPSIFILVKLQHFQFVLSKLIQTISVFVVATLFGFFWAATFATIRLNDALPKDWEQKNIVLTGVVATLPELTERGERFQFDVEHVLTPETKVPRHLSLNFYQQANPDTLNQTSTFHAGQRWQLTVRLKRPHSTYNPHGFDFEAWALAENIRATGTIRNKSGYKKLNNFVYKPKYIIENWRENIGNYISHALENKPYSGVIRALVVGDDSQISQADWNVYLRTGVNHLMSISGLHITMLAGLAFSFISLFWRRFPTLVMRMPTRKAATIAGVLVAIMYASLAGWSVPTQRTIYMLVTFALALFIGRNLAISRVLAIALLVVVLFDPWAVNAPGFWLSFGAVAIIAYVTVARLQLAHWLKEAVNTQWAITLGLLPLLISMFGQTSIVSPIANAFAIPVISLVVVPLAILGSLLHVDFILHAAHFVLEICMQALNWLATFRLWQQAAPPMWTALIAIFGVLWMLLPRGFPQRWLGLVMLLPLFFVVSPKPAIGEMHVAVLDVGQGLAVTIQTANHALLYDAGPRYSAHSDAGSKIVVPFLRGQGMKKLDGFIVSHNDDDHSGGAASVLAQVPVKWVASSFEIPKVSATQKRIKCFAGQRWQWDGVKFEVLYPRMESYENPNLTDNNRSCVVKVTSKYGNILLTGDIEKEAEAALLESNANVLKSDILVAPHHGSKTSSTPAFIQAVGTKYVVFTVGYLNRFKHPKPMIINSYAESGAVLYRSDYQGAVNIDFLKDKAIQIKAWRESEPRYWQEKYASNF